MAITQLTDLHAAFSQAYNAQNRTALLAFYQPESVFVAQPGQSAVGLEAIGSAIDGFLALKGKLQMRTLYIIETGETALTSAHWTLHGTGPDGKPVVLEGKSIEVLRRRADGAWLYVIDHPFGA